MTVAVAVALYNGARFVEKQLDTIREQSLCADNVVLCDDGSKDNTFEIVSEYIAKHGLENTWKLYRNEKNLGYIKNFYKAMSLCDAELIFLSDQDDIWEKDKIEKMTKIMESNKGISLLSCKYGIIDAVGDEQRSIIEPKANENRSLRSVSTDDIMRAYRWPGMVMCIRKSFFDSILTQIKDVDVAHDLVFAFCAADNKAFYEYDYVGAYHRRHDNNVAREEHRLFKMLNLKKKLSDISALKRNWSNFLQADITLSDSFKGRLKERLALLEEREYALENKSLIRILKLYIRDRGKFLRKASFICDIWLVCFGKR